MIFALLNSSRVQNFIANQTAACLSEKLQTEVSVGQVHYRLFNTFSIKDLRVNDLTGDTLFYAQKAFLNFDFRRFFSGKFVFNAVEFERLKVYLVVDSLGGSNIDFILRTFSSPSSSKQGANIDFNFKHIRIAQSSFKLKNSQRDALTSPFLFDANNIHFTAIDADMAIDYWRGDSISARVDAFSAKERSGLIVTNLKTKIQGIKNGFRFPYLHLEMPNSRLTLDSVKMEYPNIKELNDVLNTVRWQAQIKNSGVALKDLSAFVPEFSSLSDPIRISGRLSGRISNFRIHELELQYRNSLRLKADVDINGIPNIEETFIYADIKDFRLNKGEAQDFIAKLTHTPFVLPEELSRLGIVKYQGNISGFFSNLVAYGNIYTDVGNLRTDILLQWENQMRDLKYNGTMQSRNFQLGTLLSDNLLGKIAFKINTKGSKLFTKGLQGKITGQISEIFLNEYIYRNINVDGYYDGSGFDGMMQVDDANLTADFNGKVDLTQELPVFNFDLKVTEADLHALNLTEKYKNSRLSFKGNTNMVGNSLDNMNGYLSIDSIFFANADKELIIRRLLFESQVNDTTSRFSVSSDIINGYFDGQFKYSAIPSMVASVVQTYLPALSGKNIVQHQQPIDENSHIDIKLIVNDTRLISDVLELPFKLDGITTISGYVDDGARELNLDVATPYFSVGKRTIRDIVVNFDNEKGKLNLSAKGNYNQNNANLNFNLQANAANDVLNTQFAWNNRDSVINAGELQFNTELKKSDNLTSALITFLPTEIILNDSVWNIHRAQIVFNPDTTWDIRNFRLQNDSQYITVGGIVSKNETDRVLVEMNDIDLDFIMGLLNLQPISINGRTTGMANLYGIQKQPAFEANLFVKNAELNKSPIGDAYVYSSWDYKNQELLLSGTFVEGADTVALANGIYSVANDSVDLIYDAKKLNLAFIGWYIEEIFQEFEGRGTGSVRMYGKGDSIAFEGNVFVDKGLVKVGVLNTTYTFADTVYLTRKGIRFDNIHVYDKEKKEGIVHGLITHDGTFMNLTYDINISARNILALDTKSTDNSVFYGTAYATGQVRIHGDETVSHININAVSQPHTKMYISLGNATEIYENDFITFETKDTTTRIAPTLRRPQNQRINTYLTMFLDVTPDADIQLIISPESGDMITANGTGSVRLEYDDAGDKLNMYGGYVIERGNYTFTLQNLIRKQFRIDQGSNILFSGDPERAQLDIRAIHSLTASLYDLMSSDILKSTDRTSVPVEAVLYLTDELTLPTIRFDVNLPSSDETLKMQVKNLINTEEMMNRQMAYLLLFGKFYTPEYMRTSGNLATNTVTNFSSLVSGAAFGQLNNYLSQIAGNFSLGVNIRSTGYGNEINQEYEGAIIYQPNNRLIINGNIGYRDDNLAKNKIIGDLDMEYILNQNGKWRMKAYNHTVDRYSLRAAPFIQGVGIMYKESFNRWSDLWHDYIKSRQKRTTIKKDSIDTMKQNRSGKTLNPIINDEFKKDTVSHIDGNDN